MAKQALVIGLGRFGVSVARAFVARGVEVLAADIDANRVQAAADAVTEAVVLDATNADSLGQLAPDRRDLCLCAVGDDSIRASILCTALLREMGGKRVVARASDPLHARILHCVGAHEVVDPLRDFGARFATHLLHDNVLGELPLGPELVITEMRPIPSMIGQTLIDLNLPRRAGITVVAVRTGDAKVTLPEPQRPLAETDVLIVVSRPEAVGILIDGGKK
ncbi:MAG TPA: TrkA family potassium uptake protein [Candidatus Krumholzibacteria bacterium]|nr:TrkA family potassium uptake protein [Candidatus Krumholzibacteria bacterium]HPD70681.1 TrkA family potassium uptake protein [Candidatus Krumholzibacteria bacterium]HRY39619.1 TrkA family potassium uptake protein [Candidatus Krumholzibacteria bacterium]